MMIKVIYILPIMFTVRRSTSRFPVWSGSSGTS